ncbi:MAG: C2H2-type zinc finger protein [Oscillospiraceae bacterium]|nr:C2H2-type zinc finger protein [Oscillospiraceae bacterium]
MGKTVGLTFDEAPAHACPHCGKAYKTPEALAKHIKDKHPEAVGGSGEPPAGSAPWQE